MQPTANPNQARNLAFPVQYTANPNQALLMQPTTNPKQALPVQPTVNNRLDFSETVNRWPAKYTLWTKLYTLFDNSVVLWVES